MKPLPDLSRLTDDELVGLARRVGTDLPDAPPWLLQSALSLWRAPPAAAPTLGQRIAAALSFDSWAPAAALAVRSAGPSAVRQLLYTAGDCDVDLRLSQAADGVAFDIAGQVLGPVSGVEVWLQCGAAPPLATALDDFGEFRFEGLGAGPCTLHLRTGGLTVQLPEFELGSQPP